MVTSQGGAAVKNPAANKRRGFHPWIGKSPGGGNDNPLQYSCLKNPIDREAWWATAHGGKSLPTHLSRLPLPHPARVKRDLATTSP